MTIDQWLTSLNLSDASFSALVWVLVLGTGLFVWKKLWPWLVSDYWPNRLKRLQAHDDSRAGMELERNNLLAMMRDALIELKVIAGQQLMLMQRHDTESRNLANALIEQQRAVLERLNIDDKIEV